MNDSDLKLKREVLSHAVAAGKSFISMDDALGIWDAILDGIVTWDEIHNAFRFGSGDLTADAPDTQDT